MCIVDDLTTNGLIKKMNQLNATVQAQAQINQAQANMLKQLNATLEEKTIEINQLKGRPL